MKEERCLKTWVGFYTIRRIMLRAKAEAIRKKAEAEYFGKILWMMIKININLNIKVKRWGRQYDTRCKREIRRCLMILSSTGMLREPECGETIVAFMTKTAAIDDLQQKIKDTVTRMRLIKQKFSFHAQIRTAQTNILVQMIYDERSRIIFALNS